MPGHNKLTQAQQDEIYRLWLKGWTAREIREKTGHCINQIRKHRPLSRRSHYLTP